MTKKKSKILDDPRMRFVWMPGDVEVIKKGKKKKKK